MNQDNAEKTAEDRSTRFTTVGDEEALRDWQIVPKTPASTVMSAFRDVFRKKRKP